jgi:hypothetical protein
MFSSLLIAFLVGLSVFAWSYNRFMRTTGHNTQKAVVGSALVAVLVFVATLLLLFFVGRYLEA